MSVPTMVDNDNIINDSHEILFYVNKNFKVEDNLFPEDSQAAIKKSLDTHYAFSIEGLTMGTALTKSPIAKIALSRGLTRGSNRCRQLMKRYPEFRSVCEAKLSQENERRRLILSRDNNYELLQQQAINICNMLERDLAKHDFVVGNKYSLADVVWTVFLARLTMIKFDSLINEREHLKVYWERMQQRKSFKEANLCMHMEFKTIFKIMIALIFTR